MQQKKIVVLEGNGEAAAAISSDLARIEVEEFEKAANEQMKTL